MKDLNYVGKSLVRNDSYDKARGKTIYVGDMKRVNMLYAKLVLSDRAHAEIEIDKTEALEVEGIKAIYTYEDITKIKFNPFDWHSSVEGVKDQYLLSEKARYVGDKIAVVIGESKKAVEIAISKLDIAYRDIGCVIGIDNARGGDKKIHGDSNIAFQKDISVGDWEKAFEDAEYIVKDKGITPKMHHAAIEPHICLTEFDENRNIVIHSPCQLANQIQMHVSNILNIPFNRVRVVKAIMGGSFGGKTIPIIEPVAAYITSKFNMPVMLYMDRTDSIIGTVTRNASEITVETAVNKEGKILGRKICAEVDGGAYNTNASAITMALGKKLFRLYDIENQYYDGRAYYTNTIPGGACRGYGSPQAHAVTEVNIDNVAKKLNMDPCDFRLINLVKEGAEDPTGGLNIGKARIRECVLKGMEDFDWKNRRLKVKEKNTDRYSYGIGMACGTHGNGYTGGYPDYTSVDLTIYSDGSVYAKMSLHDLGCGTITIMEQILAEALDTDIKNVRVTEADTFATPEDSAGTQASRVTYVCGSAIKKAGEELKEKLIKSLSQNKKIDRENLEIAQGHIYDKVSKEKYSYQEIVKEHEKLNRESMNVFVKYSSPSNPASFAAYFTEVEVDRYTGLVNIIDSLAIHDIGKSINPMLVEGQIQGGVQFSLGMALYEDILTDNRGYVKSRNFSKYHIINSTCMPDMKIITIEDEEPNGPYGAKSVGEMATVAPAPAVMNAINHALDSNIIEYPATPEVIINALNKNKR